MSELYNCNYDQTLRNHSLSGSNCDPIYIKQSSCLMNDSNDISAGFKDSGIQGFKDWAGLKIDLLKSIKISLLVVIWIHKS